MGKKIFEHRSTMNGTAQQLWEFHAHPNAFSRLTPPPIFIQMMHNQLTTLTEGEVDFRMWIGPFPVRWHARHEPGPIRTSFVDRMLRGPLAHWEHVHLFQDVPNGVELVDRVTLEHKPGIAGLFTRLMFDGLPLKMFFTYRHLRTRLGLGQMS